MTENEIEQHRKWLLHILGRLLAAGGISPLNYCNLFEQVNDWADAALAKTATKH